MAEPATWVLGPGIRIPELGTCPPERETLVRELRARALELKTRYLSRELGR